MQSLEEYKIDSDTGCLLRKTTPSPDSLLPFKHLLENSHELLSQSRIRDAIKKLPMLDLGQLRTHEEQRLAHKVLTFLASQYVWQDGDRNSVEVLPTVIAVPLMEVSLMLGCQPLLGHIDLVLSNCFVEEFMPGDTYQPKYFIEMTPSEERNWIPFIARTADVEMTFAKGAKLILQTVRAANNGDADNLTDCLSKLASIISTMRHQMLTLLDELDAKSFYCEMRQFLSGWSHGALEKGLVYEGVSDDVLTGAEVGGLHGDSQPSKRVYQGASAGQSCSLQALDAFLGIVHFPDIDNFFVNIRKYMITEHRKFIEDLLKHANIRVYIEQNHCINAKKAYNECVTELERLRKEHVAIVVKFIMEPAQIYNANVESLKNTGTGGQALTTFLNKIIEKTHAALC